MKKFKYPLAITGTVAEREALIPKLEELGYKWGAHDRDDGAFHKYLLTNYSTDGSNAGEMGNHFRDYGVRNVPASNQQLVLALAAMVDDNQFHKGEYIKVIKNGSVCGPLNSIHEIKEVVGSNFRVSNKGMDDTIYSNYVRKATAEEIINHFDKGSVKQAPTTSCDWKKGDYAVVVSNQGIHARYYKFSVGDIFKCNVGDNEDIFVYGEDDLKCLLKSECRKATQEEIDKFLKGTIKETKATSYYANGHNPGDWVVCIKTEEGLYKKEGDVFQLVESPWGANSSVKGALYFKSDSNVDIHRVRRAESFEIPIDGKPYNLNDVKKTSKEPTSVSSHNFAVGDWVKNKSFEYPVRISKIGNDGPKEMVFFDAAFKDGKIISGDGAATIDEIYKVEAPIEENDYNGLKASPPELKGDTIWHIPNWYETVLADYRNIGNSLFDMIEKNKYHQQPVLIKRKSTKRKLIVL